MVNHKADQHSHQDRVEVVPYREHQEIARVILMSNSEVIIYRDHPGHLLFGLFTPVSKRSGN